MSKTRQHEPSTDPKACTEQRGGQRGASSGEVELRGIDIERRRRRKEDGKKPIRGGVSPRAEKVFREDGRRRIAAQSYKRHISAGNDSSVERIEMSKN